MTTRIVRLERWIHPCFDEIIRAQPGFDLVIMDPEGDPQDNWALLSKTDIYQISPAKDEVPVQWQATGALLDKCPRLKVVSTTGAGYDTVDVNACTQRGILVVNQAGGNADSVAEHTFALMLALVKRIPESTRALQQGSAQVREHLMGHELHGKTLGLVGIGQVGTRVARLATAFGLKVLACDPWLDQGEIRARGATPVSFDELLTQSDIVSLHCPRNEETLNLFGTAQFQRMKPGSLFLSTARGGIHDEDALYAALRNSHLAGAGLDVWRTEPPRADHPLLQLINVVSTYHTAGVTHEARRNVAEMSARQILGLCAGRRPPRMINPGVAAQAIARIRADCGNLAGNVPERTLD